VSRLLLVFPVTVEFKVIEDKKQVNEFFIYLPTPKTVTRVRNMNITAILSIFGRIQTRKTSHQKKIARHLDGDSRQGGHVTSAKTKS